MSGVVGAAQRLAVDGDSLSAETVGEVVDPAMQGGEELAGIEPGEDAGEGVVGGDAVLEGEMFGEPVLVGDSEAFDVGPGIGPGQGGGQRDEDDFAEVVIPASIEPGVGNIFSKCL